MKKIQAVVATLAMGLASPAAAQTVNSGATSGSNSTSGVVLEGAEASNIAPSMGAPGNMHTAPCVIGNSAGIAFPGGGFSAGGGRVNEDCVIREEAAIARALAGDRAAITHLCSYNPRLRATLVASGHCIVQASRPVRQAPPLRQAQQAPVPYTLCQRMPDGRIGVTPNTPDAISACRRDLR